MKKVPARRPEPLRFHPLLSVTTFFLGVIAMFVIQQVFAHGGNTNFIHACVQKGDGKLRIIDANGSCKPEETPLDWNIQGPPGQAGPQGPAGNGYFGLPFFCYNCNLAPFASKFAGRDFTQANIMISTMDNADLSGVIFTGGNLDRSSFKNANLTGAALNNLHYAPNFSGTQIDATGANFTNANLSNDLFHEVKFLNANLQNADFSNSVLEYSNFSGAKNMSTANLTGTKWSSTTCPDGTNSDSHNSTCVGHF